MTRKKLGIAMQYVFFPALAVFVTLLSATMILGPNSTEKSLEAFFDIRNYENRYIAFLPQTGSNLDPADTFIGTGALFKYQDNTDRSVVEMTSVPPFIVPSSGIAPHASFLFIPGGLPSGHEGIDIWTNSAGKGANGITYSRGNPVYSACSGIVHRVFAYSGDMSVMCDPIDDVYKDIVPVLKVKALYGHMADKDTKESFVLVQEGQRVEKGQLIGYQGNYCPVFSPWNVIVHLHFGLYDISKNPQIALDPTPYIGVDCKILDQIFIAGV